MSSLKVVRLLQPNTTRIEQKLPERCLQFCIAKSSNKYWAFLATFLCPCSPLEMKGWRRWPIWRNFWQLAVGVWFWWWTCRTLSTLQSLCTATYWCFDTQGRDAQDVVSLYHLIYSNGSNLRKGLTSNDYWTCDLFERWVDLPEKHSYLILLLTQWSPVLRPVFDPWPKTWSSADTLRLEFRIEKASLVEDATSAKRSNRWIFDAPFWAMSLLLMKMIWSDPNLLKKHITGLRKPSFLNQLLSSIVLPSFILYTVLL